MRQTIESREKEIKVLEHLLTHQPAMIDGSSNSKHYALKGKLKKLKIQLETAKREEYEAK